MIGKALAIGGVLLVLAGVAPVARNELLCVEPRLPAAAPYQSVLPRETHRNFADTLLTYPEWSIVHAYDDLAAVMRRSSESDFAYLSAIGGYWRNLCALSGRASREGQLTFDMRATLYVIGLSFSAEMGVKGLYETTIGRLSLMARGPVRTGEDRFALGVADAYAAFLRQTPWYDYPFLGTLGRFWREAPFGEASWTRSMERRLALTLEWGVKAVYAQGIRALAAAAPAKLTIDSVVTGMTRDQLAADPAVTLRGEAGGGLWVETPRYGAYTAFLRRVAAAGGNMREIAGNERIFVTVIGTRAPEGRAFVPVVTADVQAQPGRTRFGLLIPVSELTALIRRLPAEGAAFEHAYDF
jgi:hypothetical protein